MMAGLMIGRMALDQVHREVHAHPHTECEGFLYSKPECIDTVCGIFPLEAELNSASAIASPLAIKRAADLIRANGWILKGIYHSHVDFRAFHSNVDDATVDRILPAMAEYNFVRNRQSILAPTVTSKDEVTLPLANGLTKRFRIRGPVVDGLKGFERMTWSSIQHHFSSDPTDPVAVIRDDALQLEADGVQIVLGIPQGSTLESWVDDDSHVRQAEMYSLVANKRQETHVESLRVTEIKNDVVIRRSPCDLQIVELPITAFPVETNERVFFQERLNDRS